MLKVKGAEIIGAKSRGVFKRFKGIEDRVSGERGERGIEGAGADLAEDPTGERGLAVRGGRGVEFVEAAGDGGPFCVDFKA